MGRALVCQCVCESLMLACTYASQPICTSSWRGVIEWWRTGLSTAGSQLELLRDEESASGSQQLSLSLKTRQQGGWSSRRILVRTEGEEGKETREQQPTTGDASPSVRTKQEETSGGGRTKGGMDNKSVGATALTQYTRKRMGAVGG